MFTSIIYPVHKITADPVHKITASHLVNFPPNYQNDLAKQLIVGHNDQLIGFNQVEGSMFRVVHALLH